MELYSITADCAIFLINNTRAENENKLISGCLQVNYLIKLLIRQ